VTHFFAGFLAVFFRAVFAGADFVVLVFVTGFFFVVFFAAIRSPPRAVLTP
jgi:hypothetical protein